MVVWQYWLLGLLLSTLYVSLQCLVWVVTVDSLKLTKQLLSWPGVSALWSALVFLICFTFGTLDFFCLNQLFLFQILCCFYKRDRVCRGNTPLVCDPSCYGLLFSVSVVIYLLFLWLDSFILLTSKDEGITNFPIWNDDQDFLLIWI